MSFDRGWRILMTSERKYGCGEEVNNDYVSRQKRAQLQQERPIPDVVGTVRVNRGGVWGRSERMKEGGQSVE